MADASLSPNILGWGKKDLDEKYARLYATVENLQKSDKVNVIFPDDRKDPYVTLTINSLTKRKYIPGDIIKHKCSFKVKVNPGKDSKINILFRKSSANSWTKDRWSPSRDDAPGTLLDGDTKMEVADGDIDSMANERSQTVNVSNKTDSVSSTTKESDSIESEGSDSNTDEEKSAI